MNRSLRVISFLIFVIFFSVRTSIGPIVPGQSLWGIHKRIAQESDSILSKICELEESIQSVPDILNSKIDVVVSAVDVVVPLICTISDQVAVVFDKACSIESKMDTVESKICLAESLVSPLAACMPTFITAPTTISDSGVYCVGATIAGSIIINASDVELDLNQYRIQQGVAVGSNQSRIIIHNGVVENDADLDALSVNSGSSITIRDVVFKNALRGINFENVTGALIKNCEMTLNTTGLELSNSHKIVIDHCTAACNQNAGFCLVSSTTNCFLECKALSTGEGNTNIIDQTVFGFVSADGYGNIFERCIANSTQALSTTDSNSLIAGFALRGEEHGSKIIDCESANATTSPNGFAIPYGILLEGSFGSNLSLTIVVDTFPVTVDEGAALSWSPDNKKLAVGYAGDDQAGSFIVYSFDTVHKNLTQLTSVLTFTSHDIRTVDWSDDNSYIAIGAFEHGDSDSGGLVNVYYFEPVNNTLALKDSITVSDDVYSVAWSPDSRFLAVGGVPFIGSGILRVYTFDRIAEALTLTNSITGLDILSVSWRPDGKYLAVAVNDVQDEVRVYRFENGMLTFVDSFTTANIAMINEVAWSPNGKYIAVGTSQSTMASELFVLEFAQDVLAQIANADLGGVVGLFSVDWSADGQYIAVGVLTPSGQVRVFQFDPAIPLLHFLVDQDIGITTIQEVRWSPDGSYIAAVGDDVQNRNLLVYEALHFPSKNIIARNVVYCNSGNQCPGGIGISGSSVSNLIINNTSYSNPLRSPGGGPIVATNYAYVTNVFNEQFGYGPTQVQNISVGGCEPICMPDDQGLLSKQIKAKLCDAYTKIDESISRIANLSASLCDPTPISVATVINSAGVYCVSAPISGAISITASDVELDLNNYRITGGITISSGLDNIVLFGGTVENSGSDAIKVNSGVTNLIIENVITKNSLIGMNVEGVSRSRIKNCDMISNTTGLELCGSHNITIDSCVASCNTNAGFCLLSSTTCVLSDCKALSTGEGNTNITNQTVFGFVSTNGFGNIFERCIANSTQALSTTDSNSVVAGFALRGSEGCSKIIDSESANATTSPTGVTVPYGILLEAQFDGLVTVTVHNPGGNLRAVNWSSDGKYLAVGGSNITGNNLFVYRFDPIAGLLTKIVSLNPDGGSASDIVYTVNWSPDGTYLAVGGDIDSVNDLFVYRFDRVTETLTQVDSVDLDGSDVFGDIVYTVNWSPDGRYLAVGGDIYGITDNDLFVYRFDRVTETLTQVASVNPGGGSNVDQVFAVNWSPDGRYLAVVGAIFTPGNDLFVYRFDRETETLTQVDSIDLGEPSVFTVNWSPDGKYLAVGGFITGNDLFVYRFDRGTETLTQVDSVNPDGGADDTVRTVNWSPDGTYLAVGGAISGITGNDLIVYRFDRGTERLTEVDSINPDGGGADEVRAVNWSPDGAYLAIGGTIAGNNDLIIYTGLTFPSKNVIKNNTVYCNSGGMCPSGVGISGSSIKNMIIGNTAYSNPIPQMTAGGGPIVGSNYQFVTNVFNQLFGNAPTDLQNISLDGCVPICTLENEVLLAKQIVSKLDLIGCAPTAIFAGTSITVAGTYCLAEDGRGDIIISADCVTIDLNDRCLSGVISISSDDVTVVNGFVTPPGTAGTTANAAITIASTAARTLIQDVSIRCADTEGTSGQQGRDGISIAGNTAQIINGTIVAGTGSRRSSAGAAGGRGGHGIVLTSSASSATIQECVLMSGNGNEGFVNVSVGTAGGNGGHGILVQSSATNTKIINNLIFKTGNGGDAGRAAVTRGDGGHGIKVESGAIDTEIRGCTIRNTGFAATGLGTGGEAGKAVDDDVTTASALSLVFSNFAHNIASATKFDLQAAGIEKGVLTPNPPTSTVLNPFANIFVL